MKPKNFLVVPLLWIFLSLFCKAQAVQENLWMPNGTVNATALSSSGDTLYIGGEFWYVGPYTGGSGLLTTDSDTSSRSWPKANGAVTAIIPDGFGGWYIGGKFTELDSVKCNNLAHINNDNTVDENFLPVVSSHVRGLNLQGNRLYVRSDINYNIPNDTSYLAAFNTIDGSRIPWKLNLNGIVSTIAIKDTIMYVSGSFTKANGTISRKNLAAFNINTWNLTGWNPTVDSLVYSFIIHDSLMYAINILRDGYNNRSQVIAVNLSDGKILPWNVNANGMINLLCVNKSKIYMAGGFTTVNNNISRKYLAAFNLSDGTVTNWLPNIDASVNTMETNGEKIYVGGSFRKVNGDTNRNYLAAFNTTDGAVSSWNPGANAYLYAIDISGNKICVGGSLTSTGGVSRNSLASIDLKTGKATDWNPNIIGEYKQHGLIKAITITDSVIYAGGWFTQVNGNQNRNHFAAFDSRDGKLMSWNPQFNGTVNVIAKKHSVLYVGGEFTYIGSSNRGHFAAFELPSGKLSKWDLYFDYGVRAIAFFNNQIIIGGAFTYRVQRNFNNHGTGVLFITSFDVENWQHYYWLGPSVDKGPVNTIVVDGTTLYVGGEYKIMEANDYTIVRKHIGAFKLPSGNIIMSWKPIVDYPVNTIAVTDSVVYIGGDFKNASYNARNGLAAFNKKTGELTPWNPNASNVKTMVISPSQHTLYVGGSFPKVSEKGSSYFLAGLNNPKDITLPVEEFIENTSQSGILYPNPAQDIISIKPLESDSRHTIEIYSLLGEKVFLKEGFSESEAGFTCNIQNLPTGIYTCRITTPKQAKVSRFVILR